jgi:hypothetical protein
MTEAISAGPVGSQNWPSLLGSSLGTTQIRVTRSIFSISKSHTHHHAGPATNYVLFRPAVGEPSRADTSRLAVYAVQQFVLPTGGQDIGPDITSPKPPALRGLDSARSQFTQVTMVTRYIKDRGACRESSDL